MLGLEWYSSDGVRHVTCDMWAFFACNQDFPQYRLISRRPINFYSQTSTQRFWRNAECEKQSHFSLVVTTLIEHTWEIFLSSSPCSVQPSNVSRENRLNCGCTLASDHEESKYGFHQISVGIQRCLPPSRSGSNWLLMFLRKHLIFSCWPKTDLYYLISILIGAPFRNCSIPFFCWLLNQHLHCHPAT